MSRPFPFLAVICFHPWLQRNICRSCMPHRATGLCLNFDGAPIFYSWPSAGLRTARLLPTLGMKRTSNGPYLTSKPSSMAGYTHRHSCSPRYRAQHGESCTGVSVARAGLGTPRRAWAFSSCHPRRAPTLMLRYFVPWQTQ